MAGDSKFKIIYLTGAPASGKSTLSVYLAETFKNIALFSYGKVLASYLDEKHNVQVEHIDMREKSASFITPKDIDEVDRLLLGFVAEHKCNKHIIIDSHAVTKETYGYRITPFSESLLAALQPTEIVVLYAKPSVIVKRIQNNAQGRPLISESEADYHNNLQSSVAVNYAIRLGASAYFLDSDRPVESIAAWFSNKLN